ncbi:MAG: O-antigen ligase family protein [Planctomycetaceae bacterium]|nr:O-antigen ligase family protein [Planctomycetaceae bacterium]
MRETAASTTAPTTHSPPAQEDRLGVRSQAGSRLSFLESIFDFCLIVTIVGVPLLMAGAREMGVALFVLCSLTMGLTWALRQLVVPVSKTRFSGAEMLILLAIGLVGLQLTPLPTSALAWLSPFSRENLTLWGSPEGRLLGPDHWQYISLTPELTRSGLVLLLAYGTFFLSLTHRLGDTSDIDRVIRLVAVSATIMAIIGLGQLFFGNGKYLWLFEHPNRPATGAAKGTFVNQNHFAGFLALGVGPLIWCWQTRRESTFARQRTASWQTTGSRRLVSNWIRDWPAIAVAVVMLASLFSLSRGGIVAVGIAGAFALCASTGNLYKSIRMAFPALAFAIAGVVAFGADTLSDEVDSVVSASSLRELWSGRYQLWMALLDATPSFWPAGSGLGSHPEVYPMWLSTQTAMRYSHAENGYLQVLLELGVPGLLLLISGIALIGRWCWAAWRHGDESGRLRITALSAALLVSVLHSLIDFVWYIPGYMVVTLTIAACACRTCQLTSPRNELTDLSPLPARSYSAPILAWTLLLCLIPIGKASADVLSRTVSASNDWSAYRGHAIQAGKQLRETTTESVDSRLDLMIDELEKCVAADPLNHQALTNLAALSLRRFELNVQSAQNRMSVRQIHDTVKNAGFKNDAEVREWLVRAFGDHTKDLERAYSAAQKGLQGQPLRGEAYIVLAEIGFLASMTPDEKSALIEQAVRLRPNNPAVLLSAGSLIAESGNLKGAFELWRRAYPDSPMVRSHLVSRLAPHLSALEFATQLNPGPKGLWLLFQEYGNIDRPDEQLATAKLFIRNFDRLQTVAGPDDADFWKHAHTMFLAVENKKSALDCLKRAALVAPQDDTIRRTLIFALIEQEHFNEAVRHIDWYRLRYPEDEEITDALTRIRTRSRVHKTATGDRQKTPSRESRHL